MTIPRPDDVRDLLDAALDLLGPGAGRVEISDGDRRVRIARGAAGMAALAASDANDAPDGETTPAPAPAAAAPEGVIVSAPAVGVVVFRDQRTDRPLADVGQAVTAGQTLAFITSMDITTKVVAPRAGVIEEVYVADGDGVEYNSPLMKLLPSV